MFAQKTARSILFPIDGSDNSQRAFDFYIKEIKRPDDLVLLCHVSQTPYLPIVSLDAPGKLPVEDWAKRLQENIEKTQNLIAHFETICESHRLAKRSFIDTGRPGEAIVARAEKEGVTLIVMGSRGLNAIRRTFIGSVSDYVLHHANVAVTIVPPAE